MLPVLAALVASPVAEAGDSSAAEYRRLSDAMHALAKRNAWSGVERHYQDLLETGEPLSFRDHLNGAYAARDAGDVTEARRRLVLASGLQQSDAVASWIRDIDAHYGLVSLRCDPGAMPLSIEQMPFKPDQAAAVGFAQARITDSGVYEGYLPEGTYWFGTFEVRVRPAVSSVTIDARGQRSARSSRKRSADERDRGRDGDDPGPILPVDRLAPFAVVAGVGHAYGFAGLGFDWRITRDDSLVAGVGVDIPGGGHVSGSLSYRRFLVRSLPVFVDGQIGPVLFRHDAPPVWGPSVGAGLAIGRLGGLVLDGQGGLGVALHPERGPVPAARFGLAVGMSFG